MSRPPRQSRNTQPASSVRIISGHLRGSKLPVLDAPGLRPSPDRLRETLFNWLGPSIHGARVLDLYAGTGALGIEAASRGAGHVCLVELDRRLAQSLREQVHRLRLDDESESAAAVSVIESDALSLLGRSTEQPFDLVLLDPPFNADLWTRTLQALTEHGWLSAEAQIYVESPFNQPITPPAGWVSRRQSRAGQVQVQLLGHV